MKTRMEHILEIAKALSNNPEVFKGTRFPEDKVVDTAYFIYDRIEDEELHRDKKAKG